MIHIIEMRFRRFKVEKKKNEEFGNSYSEDYINKTLMLFIEWLHQFFDRLKRFFEEKWKQCFGEDYNVNEFTRTRQVYELLNNKITPRDYCFDK